MCMEYKYYNSEEDINAEDVVTLVGITEEQQGAWHDKYVKAETLARYYDKINPSKAKRVRECGSLVVATNTDTGAISHYRTRCNVRFCPICAWRKGMAVAERVKRTVSDISNNHKFITVTLTVKNCTGDNLAKEIENINKALNKLMRYSKVKKVVKGYYTSLEITYNKDTNTYHPHFHILMAVLPSYFKKADYRINNSEWVDLWQKAMGIDYTPQVKVKAVKDNDNTINEISSYIYYTIKNIYSLLKLDDTKVNSEYMKVIDTLDNAMSYKRAIRYSGVLNPTTL